jgi:Protein of unknown function (DUF3443)
VIVLEEVRVRAVGLFFLLMGLGFAAGCGGSVSSSSSGTTSSTGSGSANNVLSISVNGGPELEDGYIYQNAAFASATVCAPGSTSNCAVIENLLVDTGSTGLRLFAPEVASLDLPAVSASNGSAAYDCISYVSGAYMWGSVQKADVTLGSETASNVPIQVISDSTAGVPSSCSNGGSTNENTAALLGANGILGVGVEPTDCFYEGVSVCDPSSGLTSPPYPAYYTCSGTTCDPAFIAKASQVTNPVALFATDNNGVIVELPQATSPAATLSGSLIFGIGTESNNQLPSSATEFTLTCDDFTTVFDGQTFGITNTATCAGPGSFIDSGSNALYFPNVPNIAECPSNTPAGDLSGLYCPATTQNYSATNEGGNGASKSTSFSVANAETLFTTSTTDSDPVQPTLAGLNPTGYGFDWGLPFFYGVNVYSAIDGQSVPSGAPAAPWWAY